MPEFSPGDVFVDHRIEGLAGRGGMGVVYRATQLGLDRLVALKVVKPANVLLGAEDHAYLTDFGLTKRAASTDGGVGLSRTGAWVGTLGYVAPEQIRGERIDARTDVYALGCVLVHALTGSAPYMRATDEATLWAHLNAPPPSESVPPAFEGVVARA